MTTAADLELDRAFQALADPVRRRILVQLSHGDQNAGALADPFPISRPAVSRHLKVLRDAGLVSVRTDGRERWFSLSPDGVTDAEAWIDELRQIWRTSLFELKSFVDGWE